MAENKMKEVAKLLGVELYKPFNIKDKNGVELMYNPFTFKDDGLYDVYNDDRYSPILNSLLTGKLEIEQTILDKVEKRYLEGVLRPFKDRVMSIIKNQNKYHCYDDTYIYVCIKHYDGINNDNLLFPCFSKDDMYKGMALNKRYTLEELGLFEDD